MTDQPKHESPLSRARRLTQEQVDAGYLHPWVMGDEAARDRQNAAEDRRAEFRLIRGSQRRLQSRSTV